MIRGPTAEIEQVVEEAERDEIRTNIESSQSHYKLLRYVRLAQAVEVDGSRHFCMS